ncbi:MAG TPA: hypothetical protein VFV19_03690 [Candidatus Polarisedimenticolaceae bacterium]|nr:hypothetical protein [Candidatus Polarisedimenticolaceae bacterium]
MLSDQALTLVLDARGRAILPIAGHDSSMTPHFSGGDLVAAGAPHDAPRPGDVIVFVQQDYLVVHRYLGAARDPSGRPCLRTRGDGRNELDPAVPAGAVRARVVAVRRDGVWRSLEGALPSLYARCVARHDLFWAAAGVLGRKVGLGGLASAFDRTFLRLAAAFLFTPLHPRVDAPDGTVPESSV